MSLVFIAAEIVHSGIAGPGLTERAPWLATFTFGLQRRFGFGFAESLAEIGLPKIGIPHALFLHRRRQDREVAVIVAVSAAIVTARQFKRRFALPQPERVWHVAPYAIGSVSALWLIERPAAF